MTTARTARESVEVLSTGSPKARVARESAEVLNAAVKQDDNTTVARKISLRNNPKRDGNRSRK